MRRAVFFVLASALAASAGAQSGLSTRVRVYSAAPAALAASLEAGGFDVLEGSVRAASVDVIAFGGDLQTLTAMGLPYTVEAVGQPLSVIQSAPSPDPVPAGYPTLTQIMTTLGAAEASYPGLCDLVDLTAVLGTPATYEGRHLYAIKVSDNVAVDEDEPEVLVVACHHCRETVTPVLALDILARLTTLYGVDQQITQFVDSHEIWIAPVWNPDGYEYVFNTDNMWRKNRRPVGNSVGIDLNRNYPFGWSSSCAGSTTASSATYKGPSAGSEAETQTMMAFGNARRFSKVLDYHSYGREVLHGYTCLVHPFASWLQQEAVAMSTAAGYAGHERAPSAMGEHYQWQLANHGTFAFLMETATAFQPSYATAVAEASLVWPGTIWLLNRPAPVPGHVRDACTGAPVPASIAYAGVTFANGETNATEPLFGRYHAYVPPGNHTITFTSPGYISASVPVSVGAATSQLLDVNLVPQASVTLLGTGQLGTNLSVDLLVPLDAGRSYVAGCSASGTVPGTPVNGCVLPLNVDAVTLLSVQNVPPFSGFAGVLGAGGQATATLAIPAVPGLAGVGLDFAALTFEPAPFAVFHVTPAAHLIILP